MRSNSSVVTARRLASERIGFTVIELVVVVFIVGLLIALIIPAVQAARESSRRTQCASNLRQLGLAMGAYDSLHRHFPPGNISNAWGQHVALLPHLDQEALYRRVDFAAAPYAEARKSHANNDFVRATLIPVFACPSDFPSIHWVVPNLRITVIGTSYAANFGTGVQKYGYNGMFRHPPPESRGPVTSGEVTDGLSYTAAMSEILVTNGTNDVLRVNWNTERGYTAPEDLDKFIRYCESHTADDLKSGNPWTRGRPWTYGDAGYTWYNHVLTPNRPSFINGALVQYGAYTAARSSFKTR